MLTRRNLLVGLIAAPAVIRTPGLLMPVKALPADAASEYVALTEVLRPGPLGAIPRFYLVGNGVAFWVWPDGSSSKHDLITGELVA